MANNPYWERITAIAERQRSKGLRDYGRGIEADTVKIDVRIDRIEEELIDALMYLEHLRDGLTAKDPAGNIVEVVRCKDCIYHHTFACFMFNPDKDDFCNHGARRKDDA